MENKKSNPDGVRLRMCVTCVEPRRLYHELNYGDPTVLEILKLLRYDDDIDLNGADDLVICLGCYYSLIRHFEFYNTCMNRKKNFKRSHSPDDDEGASAAPAH